MTQDYGRYHVHLARCVANSGYYTAYLQLQRTFSFVGVFLYSAVKVDEMSRAFFIIPSIFRITTSQRGAWYISGSLEAIEKHL